MIKVNQTLFGGEGQGNCFTACLASMLEKNIEDVPNFRQLHADRMGDQARIWVRENTEYDLVMFYIGGDSFTTKVVMLPGRFIAAYPSPNKPNTNHAVIVEIDVYGDISLVHDPNPDGKPIEILDNPLWVYFFVI